MKLIIEFVIKVFKKWLEENEEKLKELLWNLIMTIVQTIRKQESEST